MASFTDGRSTYEWKHSFGLSEVHAVKVGMIPLSAFTSAAQHVEISQLAAYRGAVFGFIVVPFTRPNLLKRKRVSISVINRISLSMSYGVHTLTYNHAQRSVDLVEQTESIAGHFDQRFVQTNLQSIVAEFRQYLSVALVLVDSLTQFAFWNLVHNSFDIKKKSPNSYVLSVN